MRFIAVADKKVDQSCGEVCCMCSSVNSKYLHNEWWNVILYKPIVCSSYLIECIIIMWKKMLRESELTQVVHTQREREIEERLSSSCDLWGMKNCLEYIEITVVFSISKNHSSTGPTSHLTSILTELSPSDFLASLQSYTGYGHPLSPSQSPPIYIYIYGSSGCFSHLSFS